MDVRDDERLAQDLDHRDRSADAGLEAQLHAGRRSGREELRPSLCDQLLVGGDDVLAAVQQLDHGRRRRIDAAHHLGDDGDRRVVRDLAEVRGEHPARRRVITLLPGVADQRLDDAQPVPGRALDVVRRVGEEPVDRRADGAIAEQRNRYVNRRHEPPRLPRGRSARAAAHPLSRSASRRAPHGARPSAGCPRSISATQSRAKVPSLIAASAARMFSRTCSSTIFGPTACEPYSAVSEIE